MPLSNVDSVYLNTELWLHHSHSATRTDPVPIFKITVSSLFVRVTCKRLFVSLLNIFIQLWHNTQLSDTDSIWFIHMWFPFRRFTWYSACSVGCSLMAVMTYVWLHVYQPVLRLFSLRGRTPLLSWATVSHLCSHTVAVYQHQRCSW